MKIGEHFLETNQKVATAEEGVKSLFEQMVLAKQAVDHSNAALNARNTEQLEAFSAMLDALAHAPHRRARPSCCPARAPCMRQCHTVFSLMLKLMPSPTCPSPWRSAHPMGGRATRLEVQFWSGVNKWYFA